MSSLLLFLPTSPALHTHPISSHPSASFPPSPQSSNENRQELGFELDEVVTGFIQMHSMLQPGVRVKKVFFFFHSLFPHICPNFLSALISLFPSVLPPYSRKQSKPDLNFKMSFSVKQHFLALKQLRDGGHNKDRQTETVFLSAV